MSDNLSSLSKSSFIKNSIESKIQNMPYKAFQLGAKSFYDFLGKDSEKEKKAYFCKGTSCLVSGKSSSQKEKLLKSYDKEDIGEAQCLGLCHQNHDPYSLLSGKIVGEKEFSVYSMTTDPILSSVSSPIEDLKCFFDRSSKEILNEIMTSRLRGRGGAGFPMGQKMKFCLQEKADTKFLICNADEGDPGSFTDKYLLEKQPELVLVGMALIAKAIGAKTAIVFLRYEYPTAHKVLKEKIKELESCLNWSIDFKIVLGAGSYVCGEETALIQSLEGQRPEVRVRPPFPAQSGLFQKPTLVNNVESFANVVWILKNGGEAYAKRGTSKSTGTKLLSLDVSFEKSGVYEVEMGTPLIEILKTSGDYSSIKAIQIGGPLGGVVPESYFDKLTLDFESFDQNKFLLGHASFVGIPKEFPMIDYIKHLFDFTREESCGKCFPCRLGSEKGYQLVKNSSQNKISKNLFQDLLSTLEHGSLCALGGGLPTPVLNILEHFEEEIEGYFN